MVDNSRSVREVPLQYLGTVTPLVTVYIRYASPSCKFNWGLPDCGRKKELILETRIISKSVTLGYTLSVKYRVILTVKIIGMINYSKYPSIKSWEEATVRDTLRTFIHFLAIAILKSEE